jgi:hypothetical protein
MKSSKLVAAALSLVTLASIAGNAFADNRFPHHPAPRIGYGNSMYYARPVVNTASQEARIQQGIRARVISRDEAKRLQIGVNKVNDYQRRALADRRITPTERSEINRLNTNLNIAISDAYRRR